MINGAHVVVYSWDAETARAFFRDILGLPAVRATGPPAAASAMDGRTWRLTEPVDVQTDASPGVEIGRDAALKVREVPV
jgi:catechol 2,3-dioxygenase-like lactoylglutathione lyase family enzyme